ncbi:hypothetical protein HDU79_002552 [Rhizoclosmatium sp. JEL0117]|nr:hypothetical protein HDU79_002552 [Rhizoclosmatium sp. JEL0117]
MQHLGPPQLVNSTVAPLGCFPDYGTSSVGGIVGSAVECGHLCGMSFSSFDASEGKCMCQQRVVYQEDECGGRASISQGLGVCKPNNEVSGCESPAPLSARIFSFGCVGEDDLAAQRLSVIGQPDAPPAECVARCHASPPLIWAYVGPRDKCACSNTIPLETSALCDAAWAGNTDIPISTDSQVWSVLFAIPFPPPRPTATTTDWTTTDPLVTTTEVLAITQTFNASNFVPFSSHVTTTTTQAVPRIEFFTTTTEIQVKPPPPPRTSSAPVLPPRTTSPIQEPITLIPNPSPIPQPNTLSMSLSRTFIQPLVQVFSNQPSSTISPQSPIPGVSGAPTAPNAPGAPGGPDSPLLTTSNLFPSKHIEPTQAPPPTPQLPGDPGSTTPTMALAVTVSSIAVLFLVVIGTLIRSRSRRTSSSSSTTTSASYSDSTDPPLPPMIPFFSLDSSIVPAPPKDGLPTIPTRVATLHSSKTTLMRSTTAVTADGSLRNYASTAGGPLHGGSMTSVLGAMPNAIQTRLGVLAGADDIANEREVGLGPRRSSRFTLFGMLRGKTSLQTVATLGDESLELKEDGKGGERAESSLYMNIIVENGDDDYGDYEVRRNVTFVQ